MKRLLAILFFAIHLPLISILTTSVHAQDMNKQVKFQLTYVCPPFHDGPAYRAYVDQLAKSKYTTSEQIHNELNKLQKIADAARKRCLNARQVEIENLTVLSLQEVVDRCDITDIGNIEHYVYEIAINAGATYAEATKIGINAINLYEQSPRLQKRLNCD